MRILVSLCALATCTTAAFGQVRETHPLPKSPLDSLNTLSVREGFQVELVVSEPLVKDPIYLDWGPDGKLWVVEMADYNDDTPGGRVRYLEDTDGDGHYDCSTVFLDGLQNPTSVMPWRDGVLVSAAPEIFFASDTDGDGAADQRKLLYRGFGEGNQQHRVNGFAWGLDNWLYVANGDSGGEIESVQSRQKISISGRDLRIRPDVGTLDAQTGQTQFGRRRDDWGNWFSCSNPVPLRHLILADHYLRRNPHVASPAVRRDIARSDNTQVFPIAEVISHWSGYQSPGRNEAHRFTSAAGISIYRDDLFGPDFARNSFVCEPLHNLVHRRILAPDGITFSSRRPTDEIRREFLASSDSWFRPTTVRTGPDGALWITDMYRVAIEHADYMSDAQKARRDVLLAGRDRGRIYRVVPTNRRPRAIPDLDAMTTTRLVAALDSPNGWQRDTVQRLLLHRSDRTSIPDLIKLLTSPRDVTRLHALCTLDGLDALPVADLIQALRDPHPGVRRHAVRLAEERLPTTPRLVTELAPLVDDVSPHVRLQLAYTFGESQDPMAAQSLAQLLSTRPDEPYLVAAVMSSLGVHNLAEVLTSLFRQDIHGHASIADVRIQVLEVAAAYGQSDALENTFRSALKHLDSSTAGLRTLTPLLRVARQNHIDLKTTPAEDLKLRRTVQRWRQVANDDDTLLEDRVAILNVISWLPREAFDDRSEFMGKFLVARYDRELQRAALSALRHADDEHVSQVCLSQWSHLSPDVRTELIDVLLTRHEWTKAFVSGLATKVISAAELSPSHRQRLLTHESPQISHLAQNVFAGGVSSDRAEVLERYSANLPRKGDVSRGRALFNEHCAACHQVHQVGHAVGPDLLAVKNRSPLAILTAVLDPSRTIEDKYRSYTVITVDGQTFSGVLTSESSNSLSLVAKGGKQHVVLRKDVEDLIGSTVSLMPVGLEQELSVEKMSDLVAYVSSLRPAPKKLVGNSPQEITVSSDGLLRLSASSSRIYGSTLTFESQYRNLGFWQSEDDLAAWSVQVPSAADYEVVIDYACAPDSANSLFVLDLGSQQLSGSVASTKSWEDYRETIVGTVHLDAGQIEVELRPQGPPAKSLIDLRAILLRRSK